jgi:hypothetical protein
MRSIDFNEIELNGFLFHSTVPTVPAGMYCLHSDTHGSDQMAIQHLHITEGVLAKFIRNNKALVLFYKYPRNPFIYHTQLQWKTTTL